jgi:Zn-dependent peptidase ImmA (M78 family)
MPLNELLNEAYSQKVQVVEHQFQTKRLRGLYTDGVITINSSVSNTTADRTCIVAEELGHHFTTVGNILDQSSIQNRKQERRARQWAYYRLVPISKIVQAYQSGVRSRHELAEYLHITEEFLEAAIQRYREIYELCTVYDRFVIYFDPLAVVEMFE